MFGVVGTAGTANRASSTSCSALFSAVLLFFSFVAAGRGRSNVADNLRFWIALTVPTPLIKESAAKDGSKVSGWILCTIADSPFKVLVLIRAERLAAMVQVEVEVANVLEINLSKQIINQCNGIANSGFLSAKSCLNGKAETRRRA